MVRLLGVRHGVLHGELRGTCSALRWTVRDAPLEVGANGGSVSGQFVGAFTPCIEVCEKVSQKDRPLGLSVYRFYRYKVPPSLLRSRISSAHAEQPSATAQTSARARPTGRARWSARRAGFERTTRRDTQRARCRIEARQSRQSRHGDDSPTRRGGCRAPMRPMRLRPARASIRWPLPRVLDRHSQKAARDPRVEAGSRGPT